MATGISPRRISTASLRRGCVSRTPTPTRSARPPAPPFSPDSTAPAPASSRCSTKRSRRALSCARPKPMPRWPRRSATSRRPCEKPATRPGSAANGTLRTTSRSLRCGSAKAILITTVSTSPVRHSATGITRTKRSPPSPTTSSDSSRRTRTSRGSPSWPISPRTRRWRHLKPSSPNRLPAAMRVPGPKKANRPSAPSRTTSRCWSISTTRWVVSSPAWTSSASRRTPWFSSPRTTAVFPV